MKRLASATRRFMSPGSGRPSEYIHLTNWSVISSFLAFPIIRLYIVEPLNFPSPKLKIQETSASNCSCRKFIFKPLSSRSIGATSSISMSSACWTVICCPNFTPFVCPHPMVGTLAGQRYASSLRPSASLIRFFPWLLVFINFMILILSDSSL